MKNEVMESGTQYVHSEILHTRQSRARKHQIIPLYIAIVLAILINSYVVYYNYHYGNLRGLIEWDDCAVIFRGIKNLDLLAHANSIMGVLYAVRHFEVHAPLSDAQTMVGLLFSGGRVWGPYSLSACWLALVLIAVLKALDRQNWALVAAIFLFIVVQPLTINALTYIKSDWAGGLLLAASLFLLNAGVVGARPDLKNFAAALLGLAILSKLTAFYLPVVALGILLLFEWHSAIVSTLQRARRLPPGVRTPLISGADWRLKDRRAFSISASMAILPYILFFFYKIKSITNYIISANGSTWDDGFTQTERIIYYSPFDSASWMHWGNLHLFMIVFSCTAAIVSIIKKNYSYLASLFILFIIGVSLFVPLIVARSSNYSFSATFLGVLMAATLISMKAIADSLPRWGSLAILIVTVLTALPARLPFNNTGYYPSYSASDNEIRQLVDNYARIVDTISKLDRGNDPHIIVFYDHLFAPHLNIAINYFLETGHLPTVDRVDSISDIVTSQLLDADFVLTIVPTPNQATQLIPGLFRAYPISHDPARADDIVRASGQFDSIGTFAVRGGEIHLYSNRFR